MKGVPPELDRLMWALAEEGSEKAFQEFEQRHPELRVELGRRAMLVKGLRGQKHAASKGPEIPVFRPMQTSAPMRSRGPMLLIAGFALAGFAAASYWATTALMPSEKPKPAVVENRPPPAEINLNPPKIVPEPLDNTPLPNQPPVIQNPPPDETPPYLRPKTVRIRSTSLTNALTVICESGGLRLVTPPNMPNPDVVVDYQDTTVIDMLKDLGRQYAFTAYDEGDGSVLIVPAVDSKKDPVGTKMSPVKSESDRKYVGPP